LPGGGFSTTPPLAILVQKPHNLLFMSQAVLLLFCSRCVALLYYLLNMLQ